MSAWETETCRDLEKMRRSGKIRRFKLSSMKVEVLLSLDLGMLILSLLGSQ